MARKKKEKMPEEEPAAPKADKTQPREGLTLHLDRDPNDPRLRESGPVEE